jgi:threonine aldolase
MWTRELEEVIVEEKSHIYNMESTHLTFISRVTPRPLPSKRGSLAPEIIRNNLRLASVHTPRTSLICLENTHNNWGGAVVPLETFGEVRKIADDFGLKVHLDGARIFNASQASGVPVREYAKNCDSVMFCLSKGLSSPVGSMLVSDRQTIDYARRIRKALGGGMRQAGILAACGIISLTKMVDRLKEDHLRAKRLAEAIYDLPGITLKPEEVETNIIVLYFNHPKLTIPEFLDRLKEKRVLALSVFGGVRLVTHKDVDDEDVDRAAGAFRAILARGN